MITMVMSYFAITFSMICGDDQGRAGAEAELELAVAGRGDDAVLAGGQPAGVTMPYSWILR
jgi:hypothetical protein